MGVHLLTQGSVLLMSSGTMVNILFPIMLSSLFEVSIKQISLQPLILRRTMGIDHSALRWNVQEKVPKDGNLSL